MSDFEIEGSDEESQSYGYTPSPCPQKSGNYSNFKTNTNNNGGNKKIGSLAFDDNDDDGDVYDFEYEDNRGKSNRSYGGNNANKGRIAAFSPAGGKGNYSYNARQASFSDEKGDVNRSGSNNLRLSTVSNESSALDRAKNIMDRYANKTFEAPKSNFKGGKARHFDEDDISIDDDDDPTSEQHESGDIEISESHGDPSPPANRKPPPSQLGSKTAKDPSYNSKSLSTKEEKVKFPPQLINESAVYSEYNESVPEESMRELEESAIPTEHDEDEDDAVDEYSNEEFDEVDEDNEVNETRTNGTGKNTVKSQPEIKKTTIQKVESEETEEHYSQDALEYEDDDDDNGSYSRIVYDHNEDQHDDDSVSEGSVEDVLKSSKSKILSFADLAEHAGWDPETEQSPDPFIDSQKELDVPEVSIAPQVNEPAPKTITSSLMTDNMLDLDKLVARSNNRGVAMVSTLDSLPTFENKRTPEIQPKASNLMVPSISMSNPPKEVVFNTTQPAKEMKQTTERYSSVQMKDARDSEPPSLSKPVVTPTYSAAVVQPPPPPPVTTVPTTQPAPSLPTSQQEGMYSSTTISSTGPSPPMLPHPQYPPQYQPPQFQQYPQQPPPPPPSSQYSHPYYSSHPSPYPSHPGYPYPSPPPSIHQHSYPYPPPLPYPHYGVPPPPYSYSGYYPGYPFPPPLPPSSYYSQYDSNYSNPPQPIPSSYHEIHQQKPVILELIQELNAAQAEANWAKEKLAETIVLLRKSGISSSMKSPPFTEEHTSDRSEEKNKVQVEEPEESSDGGYSEDFETSQLNLSSTSHHNHNNNSHHQQPVLSGRVHSPKRPSRNVSTSWKSLPKVSEEPDLPGLSHQSQKGDLEQEIFELLRKGSMNANQGNRSRYHPPELTTGDPITDSVAKSFLASQELLRTKLDSLRLRLQATAKENVFTNHNRPTSISSNPPTSELQPSLQDLKTEFDIQRRKSQERMIEFIRQKYPDIELEELNSFLTMTEN